jgi:hypothetical protein
MLEPSHGPWQPSHIVHTVSHMQPANVRCRTESCFLPHSSLRVAWQNRDYSSQGKVESSANPAERLFCPLNLLCTLPRAVDPAQRRYCGAAHDHTRCTLQPGAAGCLRQARGRGRLPGHSLARALLGVPLFKLQLQLERTLQVGARSLRQKAASSRVPGRTRSRFGLTTGTGLPGSRPGRPGPEARAGA